MTAPFVNRVEELRVLSTWAADPYGRILAIVGLGGMGKTSLAWRWFEHHSPEISNLAGRLWWSFYESDATQFLMHCHAYLSGDPDAAIRFSQRELVDDVLRLLRRGNFLLVLDGFERTTIAYSESFADRGSPATSHDFRRMTSVHLAYFIRGILGSTTSKMLLTSRLAPSDLEDTAGRSIPGAAVMQLGGFTKDSARELLSQFAISDVADDVMSLAATVDYHPLLTSVLAHQASSKPELLAELIRGQLHFTDTQGMVLARMRLLRETLSRLDESAITVARYVATFSHPIDYSTLSKLLVGSNNELVRESELDRTLTRLQDLGVLAWNQIDNTYSLHPVMRAMILDLNGADARSRPT